MPSKQTKFQEKLPRYERFMVKFYNEVSGSEVTCIEDIPERALKVLRCMEYRDLVKPFIAEDIAAGHSREFASIRYGVTEAYARGVGRRFGILPRG